MIFRKWGGGIKGGIKGRLELFQKFIRFGRAVLPLITNEWMNELLMVYYYNNHKTDDIKSVNDSIKAQTALNNSYPQMLQCASTWLLQLFMFYKYFSLEVCNPQMDWMGPQTKLHSCQQRPTYSPNAMQRWLGRHFLFSFCSILKDGNECAKNG